MPELPDVETLKRYVDSTSLRQPIEDVEIDAPRMLRGASAATVRDRLKGSTFKETARHGKYLFIRLSKGRWLVLHFGMTGTLKYFKDAEEAPGHTHLLLHFANAYHLAAIWQRRLGRIDLAESPAAFVEAQGLGPDAFDPGVDLEAFKQMLRGRRGAVKPALMDQGFLAGLGNIYSDEILFQAGIRPDAKAGGLSGERMTALHRAMQHVLRVAIERQADPDRLPESWLLPRRQEGAACPRCGAGIKRMSKAGRSVYFCPKCQR